MATANLLQTSVSGGTQNALSLQGDGVFFPKASTTSRLALTLTTTDKGFIVYDTTDNNIYFWNGAAWESVPSSGDAGANGSVQYNDNGIVSGASNFVYDKVTGLVTGVRYISTSSNAALPSFAVSAGNGAYNSGANEIGFSINSTSAMTLNSTGLGIATAPQAKFHANTSNPTDGVVAFFQNGSLSGQTGAKTKYDVGNVGTSGVGIPAGTSNALAFFVGGITSAEERARIDASGNLLVGATSAIFNSRLRVKASSTSASDYSVYVADSADALVFALRNDGLIYTGTKTASPYNNTTASAANVFVAADGTLGRSTSSLKYKKDVKDSIHGLADVLKLRSVTYKSKNGDDTVFGGLIAEEVHAAGLTEFVAYAPDKTPDSINYGNMVALLVSAIQELTARVQTLEAK